MDAVGLLIQVELDMWYQFFKQYVSRITSALGLASLIITWLITMIKVFLISAGIIETTCHLFTSLDCYDQDCEDYAAL